MSQRSINVNGITLAATEVGEGPPVLLLHGVTAAASFMRPEIDALAADFHVIAPDLRGHGASSRPERYTLDDHVQDARKLLTILEVAPAAVVGVSMGSYIAQGLAATSPQLISKLVLVVSKANGLITSSNRVLAEHADELADLSPEEKQRWLLQQMFAPSTPASVRAEVVAWQERQAAAGLAMTPEQVQAANLAVGTFDFRPQLATLSVPTLVVSGRHDILNPPSDGAELAELIPDARQVVFEASGHGLPWEEPERYVEVLREFLLG